MSILKLIRGYGKGIVIEAVAVVLAGRRALVGSVSLRVKLSEVITEYVNKK